MESGSTTTLLFILAAVIVAFIGLRIVIGAIKTSAKLMVWLVIAVIVLGAGYVWLQGQPVDLPTLSIPNR